MLKSPRRWSKDVLAYTPAMQYRKSYALADLDKKLEPYIGKKRGTFIEAGANDGIKQSNTLYFEQYFGWTGILIEPIPELSEACKQNRPLAKVVNAALVSADHQGETIRMTYCGLMSTTVGSMQSEDQRLAHTKVGVQFLTNGQTPYEVDVPTRTLSSIIDEFAVSEIDLLSLDIEGFEPSALRGLDLSRHAPQFILIETRHHQRHEIDEILANAYKPIAALTLYDEHSDVLFARR